MSRAMAAAAAALMLLVAQSQIPSQDTPSTNPPLVISSMYGQDLFEFYCASCHGRDGKGGGPVSSALKTPPADLTLIAERNQGAFSARKVRELVTGDTSPPLPAHGSKEMPVWGPIFQALDANQKTNEIRISNVVDYIESLQVTR